MTVDATTMTEVIGFVLEQADESDLDLIIATASPASSSRSNPAVLPGPW